MEARRNEIKDRERGEGGYEEGKWRQGEMRLKTERGEGETRGWIFSSFSKTSSAQFFIFGFPSIVPCVLYPQLYLLVEGQCIYRGSIADSHQLFCVFCIPSCISWWRASVSIVVLLLIPFNCSVCSVSPAVSPGGRPVYLSWFYC